jgi:hypothetical protein
MKASSFHAWGNLNAPFLEYGETNDYRAENKLDGRGMLEKGEKMKG